MNDLPIRRLRQDDSIDELTSLLHRAFGSLGRMGLQCTCVDQSPETTASRARRGVCFVGARDARLVATMTLEAPGLRQPCRWYRNADVASLHQFAIDPSEQGRGYGTQLLKFAERWADDHRFAELALDTPADAHHLLAFYEANGFRQIAQLQKEHKSYRSIVLSKRITTGIAGVPLRNSPHPAGWYGSLVSR